MVVTLSLLSERVIVIIQMAQNRLIITNGKLWFTLLVKIFQVMTFLTRARERRVLSLTG